MASKINRITSVLLVAIIAISLLFGAVNVEAVSKIKKNKGDFYYKINKTLYDNDSFSSIRHTYKILAFNVNSKSAKSCNRKLYNYFKKIYNRDYDDYVSGCGMSPISNIYGNTYKNGNILSIRQKRTAPSTWEYKAYNVNKKTGRRVTLKNLYKKYGYSKKSFYKALKKKQINKTKAIINENSGWLSDYEAEQMLAYAKSGKSRKGLQAYLDSQGKLCVVAKININVSAGIYQYIFRFSKK